jgi:serine protease AprX
MLRRTVLKLTALSLGLLASGVSLAAASLGDELNRAIAAAAPVDRLEVIVSFSQGGAPTSGQILGLRLLGITQGRWMQTLPMAGVMATPSQIRAMALRGDVRSIHLNRNLRYFNHDARRISGVDAVQANPDLGYTGRGVTLMVNDSGIDATHADLQYGSHVVQNVQAVGNVHALLGFLPVTVLENQLNTDISSGHGTHCAGSVGGSGANSAGLHRGVAPDADIVGYGSGAVISILDAVGGYDYAIAKQYAFNSPIRVISNSWGTSGAFDPTDPVNIASHAAYKRGIVSVFAAGNDGPTDNTHNPYAQAPWVISVGAGNKDGTLADFSSRGNPGESGSFTMPDGSTWTYVNRPSVVATGVDIVSARALTGLLPVLAAPQDIALGTRAAFYTHMSGTSMATPHVAGIVALMFEANPGLTPMQVKQTLESTADAMPGRQPHEVGSGHVDALEAVQVAKAL